MKKKRIYCLYGAEAVFCLLFYLLQAKFSGIFSALTAFPFEQIGILLRKMSLSGFIGNVLAIVIYILIGLIPVGLIWFLKRKKKLCMIDAVLMVLSVLLFVVVYFMINPGLFKETVPGGGKIILGGTFYSVFFGYIVLRILYKCSRMDMDGLLRGLSIILYVVTALFVYMIFGSCFSGFLQNIQSLQAGNRVSEIDMGFSRTDPDMILTCIFLVLQSVVNAVPYILDILVSFAGIRLLRALVKDPYADQTVFQAEKLSGLCVLSLAVTVITSMVFHIAQLIVHNRLYQIDCVVSIPLFSIAFVLTALLLAKFVRENQKLKQDNDLFI